MSLTEWDEARNELPAVRRLTYMNTGTSGPMPRRAVERMAAVLNEQSEVGSAVPDMMEKAFGRLADARKAVAGQIGATPEDVALTTSTSHGLGLIAAGVDWNEGDEVIVSGLEHISGLVPWHHAARRHGIRVVEAPLTSYALTAEAVTRAMTPRTRLICMSHVSYTTGARLPVEEVAAIAQDRGILLAVDGAQSVGAIQVDVKRSRIPLYAFPGQKWLLGPEGTGGLYVSTAALDQLDVSHVGWASLDWERTENPSDFALHPSAQRFESGTMDDAAFAGLSAATEWVDGLGREAVRARVASLAGRLKRSLAETSGVTVVTPMEPEASAGLVSFSIEGVEAKAAAEALLQRYRILCRFVPDPELVRFSVHFFNTEHEVDEVVEAVRRLAANGDA